MAASTSIASALLGPLASTAPVASRTTQQLVDDVATIKKEIETKTKELNKLETSKKKIEANRDKALAGRNELQTLLDRVINLQKEIDAMTKDSDANVSQKDFDKKKRSAVKSLADLINQVHKADQHLTKITGTTSIPEPTTTAERITETDKGIGALIAENPLGRETKKETPRESPVPKPKAVEPRVEDAESGEDEDDDDVSAVPPPRVRHPPAPTHDEDDESDEDDDDDDDDDVVEEEEDERDLHKALKQQAGDSDRRSQASPKPPPAAAKRTTTIKTTPVRSPSPSMRQKGASPRRRPEPAPSRKRAEEQDENEDDEEEDSYFEEEEDEELQRFRESGEPDAAEEMDEDYDDENGHIVNSEVQALRAGRFPPGTKFKVVQDFTGTQTGDLSVRRGDILSLVQQEKDDWWLCQNVQTQEKGVVPINDIQLLSTQPTRRRAPPSTSATTLVDAFKANKNIPDGFILSDLAPLAHMNEYHVSQTLIPKMTESNLGFSDLFWRPTADELRAQETTYQKILTLSECVKIPRIKGDQVYNQCNDS